MTIRIESFGANQKHLLKECYRIRDKVFVQEQNVDKFLEYDGFDDEAVHYLVYYNEKPAGVARWRETEEGVKLERFAILKKYRRKALASVLLKFIIEELLYSNKKIYLSSQIDVEKFYKMHGFSRVGAKFTEANIEHYKMEYKLLDTTK